MKLRIQVSLIESTNIFRDYGTFRWYDVALPTLRAWLNCDLENVFQRGMVKTYRNGIEGNRLVWSVPFLIYMFTALKDLF